MKAPGHRRILALETSGPVCRIAVRAGDTVVERTAPSEFARHSDILFPLFDRALAAAKLKLDEVDGIAVSIGPGSFTGLRVGLAAAKVFSVFGKIPLLAVPTLEAMAVEGLEAAPGAAAIAASLDARRGEVYAAVYRRDRDGGVRPLVRPKVMTPEALAGRTPPGAVTVTETPRAATIAQLGAERLADGRIEDPARLVPLYLRRPEAQVRRLDAQRRRAAKRRG